MNEFNNTKYYLRESLLTPIVAIFVKFPRPSSMSQTVAPPRFIAISSSRKIFLKISFNRVYRDSLNLIKRLP